MIAKDVFVALSVIVAKAHYIHSNTKLNFLLQRCFEDKHRGKFNFFPESELGCGPQDFIGKLKKKKPV